MTATHRYPRVQKDRPATAVVLELSAQQRTALLLYMAVALPGPLRVALRNFEPTAKDPTETAGQPA